MEGNVTERRLSVAVTPLWLDSSTTSIGPSAAAVAQDNLNREVSPRPESSDDGLPPSKVKIQTPELPRIQLPTRNRAVTETFENTEVEELIAMLRETENLEDQGDILQYLVDTQGLDYNTGDYDTPLNISSFAWIGEKGKSPLASYLNYVTFRTVVEDFNTPRFSSRLWRSFCTEPTSQSSLDYCAAFNRRNSHLFWLINFISFFTSIIRGSES